MLNCHAAMFQSSNWVVLHKAIYDHDKRETRKIYSDNLSDSLIKWKSISNKGSSLCKSTGILKGREGIMNSFRYANKHVNIQCL